jgi:dTDP-glucose 4,6-dehydratase
MKKTILVTGGCGFLGSNFVRHLYRKYPDYKIIILDALTYAGAIENLPIDINCNPDDRICFWYGNVRNAELVDTLVSQSDIVIHFAAETHVTRSIYDNLIFFETDVLGTQIIVNSVLKHRNRIEKFVHISTSEVYGTALTDLMSESHPLLPMSPYAAAKCGADRLVYSYWMTYDLPVVILRPFNQFGPRQHLEKVVPRFITSCILGEPLRVHGDGSASRDYVYVEDTCEAIDKVIHSPIIGVLNVASGQHRSILSVAQDVISVMGTKSVIVFTGERPGQVFRHTGDHGLISLLAFWQPRTEWMKGLKETAKWYIQNRSWWEKQLWSRSIPIITKTGQRELH